MKFLNVKSVTTALMTLIVSFNTWSYKFTLVWNDYCPFTCVPEKEDGNSGLASELVSSALLRGNVAIEFIQVDSWLRGLELVRLGKVDGIVFSYYPDKVQEDFLITDMPISYVEAQSFLLKKDRDWKFQGLNSLFQLKHIATYSTDRSEMQLEPLIEQFSLLEPSRVRFLSGSDILDRAVGMIEKGRLDAWMDSEPILAYTIKKHKLSNMTIVSSDAGKVMHGGILLNPNGKQAKHVLHLLNKQFNQMLENGQFARLQAKYGINSTELHEEYLAKQNKNVDKISGGSN